MKTFKIENHLVFILLELGIFFINFNKLSLLSLIFSLFITIITIKLISKINIYNNIITRLFILVISIILFNIFFRETVYYISNNILKNYSLIPISLSLFISIYLITNKGFHTIIKTVLLGSYFILFILLIGIIISFINIKSNYILITNNNLLNNTIIYSLYEIYCYILIYPITNTKFNNINLFIIKFIQIIIYITISFNLNILINYLDYPYIEIFKSIKLIGFIERIEIIFSLNYLFIFYFLLLFIFYQIKFITKKKKQLYLIIISLAIIFINLFIL